MFRFRRYQVEIRFLRSAPGSRNSQFNPVRRMKYFSLSEANYEGGQAFLLSRNIEYRIVKAPFFKINRES